MVNFLSDLAKTQLLHITATPKRKKEKNNEKEKKIKRKRKKEEKGKRGEKGANKKEIKCFFSSFF